MKPYRGKSVDNEGKIDGEWIHGFLAGPDQIMVWNKDNATGRMYQVDPETVGQATGLKASKSYRKDLEIYEGDKLNYAGLEGDVIVKWETFGWRLENTIPEVDRYIQRLSWPPIQLPSGNFEHIEIIGNIHENAAAPAANERGQL